jgi:hypothetical protein
VASCAPTAPLPPQQPRILLCHVREAKGLPVMDRATMLTDAYVCTTFGKLSHRTEVQRKTLNPVWDEKFRFEITDDELLVEGECFVAVLCTGVTAWHVWGLWGGVGGVDTVVVVRRHGCGALGGSAGHPPPPCPPRCDSCDVCSLPRAAARGGD